MQFEIVLKDDGGRGSVEPRLARPPVLFATREAALGLAARQPLVLQPDIESGKRREMRREVARRLRLIRVVAVEPPRQTDDDRADVDVVVRVGPAGADDRRDRFGRGRRRRTSGDDTPRPRKRRGVIGECESQTPPAEVDAEYERNLSFFSDLKILFATVGVVLRATGK